MSTDSCEYCQNRLHFWIFRISQGSLATYCRWGGNLCGV